MCVLSSDLNVIASKNCKDECEYVFVSVCRYESIINRESSAVL